MHQAFGLQITWYYQVPWANPVPEYVQLDSSNHSMPGMHTAIPCTGSTADQAVNTVHLQLGAAKHLTRPLTIRMHGVVGIALLWYSSNKIYVNKKQSLCYSYDLVKETDHL